MLAKVPLKRLDGKSTFGALTQYIAKHATTVRASEQIWEIHRAAQEMDDVAALNQRVKDAVYHYVLSWREGESPTDQQAFDAVAATLTALHMKDHQWVAAVHRNTEHVHTHVAVNRVNPETLKSVYPKGDWLTLDRACRELEIQHGWGHDRGPHSVQIGTDNAQTVTHPQRDVAARTAPSTRARDFAAWSGRESFQEWVGKEPAGDLKLLLERPNAKWQQAHELLAGYNLEYRIKGSGAVVVDRDDPDKLHAKASHIGRFASLSKLEERLGPFEPLGHVPIREHTDEQTRSKVRSYARDGGGATRADERQAERTALYARYTAAKQEWERTQGPKRERGFRQQRASEKTRFESLRQDNRAARERIKCSRPDTSKRLLYSVQAFVAAAKREQLRLDVERERKELRALYDRNRPGRWAEWLGQQAFEGDKAAVAALRRRRCREANPSLEALQREVGIAVGVGEPRTAVLPVIRWTIDQHGVNYSMNRTTVFRDEGRRIVFNDLDDDAIRAGLMLCREKWAGGISIDGTDEFKAKAHALAAEMGIWASGQERGRPSGAEKIEQASTLSIQPERSHTGALDLVQLSATYDKPVIESKAALGGRHEGRVVAAEQDANGAGVVVLDIGRELAVVQTDSGIAAEMQTKVGCWIQARTSGDDRFPGGYVWSFTDVRPHGLGLEFGQQP
ncbi:MAG: TraI/MobA(P) family conjugative relaxase [Methylocella sp.]